MVAARTGKWGRRLLGATAAALAVYALAAYLILPALWFDYEHQPGLATHIMVTVTAQGIPGDPLNVGAVGATKEVITALSRAGWSPADAITLRSAVEIGLSVVLHRPYADAPVSNLFLDGRRQDLAFERLVDGSADRRHHVRLWRVLDHGVEGRAVWLGAASFDRGVGLSRDTLAVTHHIDPDLDRERAFVIESLTEAGVVEATYRVTGVGPTVNGRNGEGDPYYTDGEVTFAVLDLKLDAAPGEARTAPGEVRAAPPPVAQMGPKDSVKRTIWALVLGAGRALGVLPPASP